MSLLTPCHIQNGNEDRLILKCWHTTFSQTSWPVTWVRQSLQFFLRWSMCGSFLMNLLMFRVESDSIITHTQTMTAHMHNVHIFQGQLERISNCSSHKPNFTMKWLSFTLIVKSVVTRRHDQRPQTAVRSWLTSSPIIPGTMAISCTWAGHRNKCHANGNNVHQSKFYLIQLYTKIT